MSRRTEFAKYSDSHRLGQQIRLLSSRKKFLIISADYSQLELGLSRNHGDARMLESFKRRGLHAQTAISFRREELQPMKIARRTQNHEFFMPTPSN